MSRQLSLSLGNPNPQSRKDTDFGATKETTTGPANILELWEGAVLAHMYEGFLYFYLVYSVGARHYWRWY
nr:hypothetical protein CFP56_42578 [Quercus suber]